ncbi:ATF/CREB activator [Pleodorina starrii]|uniref:Calcium-transporting ATPase n=1 Tax=Pleodorina starrii TaxID=330485 RepID=A0A9W6F4W8_9CHLO|nr:ATF/CREB activator [Pleodorina starrii]GLC55786.1 ATF/CREB activator [Pleodorina starrii]GLC68862.1 ATF/CREB activator [Pleodorina starrii]
MTRAAVANGDEEAPAIMANAYGVGFEELTKANEEKDMEFYNRVGKAWGLAKLLGSSPDRGLNPDPNATGHDSVAQHRRVFGANRHAEVPPKNFFLLVWEVVQDPILILLIAAAAVSTILGAAIPEEREKNNWIEGIAIWVAVVIVTLVGAGNDYSKDLQFRKLNAQKDRIQIKVIRGGEQILVDNTDLVVGDVVFLDTGDKVVADAIVLDSQGLTMDEASLTGESDPMKKNLNEDPWVMSGTQVTEGSGHALVIAVGPNSTWGKTMALVSEAGDDETPLQQKLGVLAAAIGKIGFAVAVCCFIAQLIKWCVVNRGFPIKKINDHGPIQFFLYAITIIVVAVPEGLPLAVTISLAYSMKKMMTDNNFVRVLAACETMGGATAICSDKTGTLTENRMTVVEGWFGGRKYGSAPKPSELDPQLLEELKMNCALNSKAYYIVEKDGKMGFVGNRTECALLLLMDRDLESNYKDYRARHEKSVEKIYGFSSAKKMASVLVRLSNKYRLYNKGAAEWVLKRCVGCMTETGVADMTPALRDHLLDEVTNMAKRGLRCICLTYRDFPLADASRPADFFEDADHVDDHLICIGIVGIKDPVRAEVPDAVKTCKRAGITVRMVTGDNIHTARHIARECGILYDMGPGKPEPVAMEGPAFRDMLKDESFVALRARMNDGDAEALKELKSKINHVRVLARSSPEDKLQLVRLLKELGEVVAVTGDGTNDAPALKESDVGLAMGIAGTEVAKEAADIVILDDNFSSIVKSVLWGRSVFSNIRKFLQFQLTVNFVALVTAFIGAVIGGHEPLNILQLLWVNLIMDTMGALALATEDPHPALLLQRPNGRKEQLINWKMAKHILVQGLYQMLWMFLCLYLLPKGPKGLEQYKVHDEEYFYQTECGKYAREVLPGMVNVTNLDSAVAFTCNAVSYCGYPYSSAGAACNLTSQWAPQSVPADQGTALCLGSYGRNTTNCDRNQWVQAVGGRLDEEFSDYEVDEYKRPLSLLFNIFICTQVANEINARRINDEYNIFEGFFGNWIFITVITLTMGFQAIIINLLGMFFKVEPLDWHEWLVSIAIGTGAWPISILTRFVSRNIPACVRFEAVHPPEIDDPALVREIEEAAAAGHHHHHHHSHANNRTAVQAEQNVLALGKVGPDVEAGNGGLTAKR